MPIPKVHRHKCSCGHIWEHERPPPTATQEEYDKQHLCFKCQSLVGEVYFEGGLTEQVSYMTLFEVKDMVDKLISLGDREGASYLRTFWRTLHANKTPTQLFLEAMLADLET